MSRVVFYIGPAGAGKTSSIRTLNPKSTFIVNALAKDLPWKGSAKQYTYIDKEKNPSGNMVKTSNSTAIVTWLNFINKNRPDIKDIVIDDNTFLTSLELLRRSNEKNYDKFNDIAQNFIDLVTVSKQLREDIIVHILHHTQVEGDGILQEKSYRAMSYGKLIDEKLGTQEAQFTIVLRAAKEKTDEGLQYVFYTRDADSTVKTPFGMFEEDKIPNDMSLVRKAITCYYDEDCE
jgi:hypothetical protein